MMVLRRLADAYRETGADIEVVALPPLGSEGGIGALVANRLDIAASGRPATAAEAPGVRHDVEGSGFGFRTVRRFEAREVEMPHNCKMPRIV